MKGLYGLKQSGREWNVELNSHLQRIRFHCMPSASCLYSKGTGDGIIIIMAYVDNMLITSPSRNQVEQTKKEIMDKWGTQDNGPVTEFLGIKITRERAQRKILLDMTAYVKGMVNKWLDKTTEKSWIPMQHIATITESSKYTPVQVKKYQELVGQLLWVSNMLRPNISFATGTLARYMSSPTDGEWNAALHMVKFLNQMSAVARLEPKIYCKGRLESTLAKSIVKAFYDRSCWNLLYKPFRIFLARIYSNYGLERISTNHYGHSVQW